MAGFSKFPGELDDSLSIPVTIDRSSEITSDRVNRLRDALLSIESELGVPFVSGTYGTVKARLDALEVALNTLGEIVRDIEGGTDVPIDLSQIYEDINNLYALYNQLLQMIIDGYGGGSQPSTSGLSKRRVYLSVSQTTSLNVSTLVQFNANSSLFTPTNSSLNAFTLSSTIPGVHTISGSLSIRPTSDTPISGATVSVLINSVVAFTYHDYGAIQSSGISRTIPFSFLANLIPSDAVSVRWSHQGFTGSQTTLDSGDANTWLSISSL